MTTYDTYGVVVEAHPDAVWDTDEIGRVNIYFTIHIRMFQSPINLQFSFTEAF